MGFGQNLRLLPKGLQLLEITSQIKRMKRILIVLSILCVALVTALGVDPLPQAGVIAESNCLSKTYQL